MNIIVRNHLESRHVRAEVLVRFRVGAERDHASCSAMKVSCTNNDLCLIVGNLLHCICPATTEFDSRLHCLHSRVHWQYLLVSKCRSDEFRIFTKQLAVKGTAGER